MIETNKNIYKELNIKKISNEEIIIDDTNERVQYFLLFFFIFVVFPSALLLFDYNRQNIAAFTATASLLLISIILIAFKEKICYKKIIINRKKQQIIIERNFLYIREVFDFKKSKLFNVRKIENDAGKIYHKKSLFIYRLYDDKKYLLKRYNDKNFELDDFITNYMANTNLN